MGILLRLYISKIISSMCVPTFFLISGYLLYYKQPSFNLMEFGRKLKRRFRSLVIPYLLWILIYIFITALLMLGESESFLSWINSVVNYIRGHGFLHIFYDSLVIETDPSYLPIGWKQDHSTPILFTL